MKDLLIINPGQGGNYNGYSNLRAYEPPLWAGMIAKFIRDHGYRVHLWDANIDRWSGLIISLADPIDLIAVVVYGHNPSASTTVVTEAGRICREIKVYRPEQKIIMVGGHVAALPDRTLKEEAVDYVSCAEGPYRILNILRGSTDPLGRDEPVIGDIDKVLTGVAWDLLPMEDYRAHNWHCFGGDRTHYASIYTSLGCPYKCDYCCIHAPFKDGPRYRTWSPESVIRQIDILVQTHGVKNLKIADELFAIQTCRTEEICDLLIDRDYGLNIWAYARPEPLTPGFLEKLKKAGINWLGVGIENTKGKVGGADLVCQAIDNIRNAGINVAGNFMFGFPDDTIESMQETLDFAIDLNCEFVNFNCLAAYPGSKLYDQTGPKDLPETWEGYAQLSYNFKPLPTKHLSSHEVLGFRDRAFETYFNNPKYLAMMENKFGLEVKEQVRAFKSPERRP